MDMSVNYFDNYSDYYEDREYTNANKKRPTKRRWRDIERFKERHRLAKEIIGDEQLYFDLLESHCST